MVSVPLTKMELAASFVLMPQQRTACIGFEDRKTGAGELCLKFSTDTFQWHNSSYNKEYQNCVEHVHLTTKETLCMDGRWKPPWDVDAWLADLKQGECGGRTKYARDSSEGSDCRSAFFLSKICHEAPLDKALQTLANINQQGFGVSTDIFFHLLQRCIEEKNLAAAREVHCLIKRRGLESDHSFHSYWPTSLFDAEQVLCKLTKSNTASWNEIILAYSKLGCSEQVIKLYHEMCKASIEPDGHVLVACLKACSNITALELGKQIHNHIVEIGIDSDVFVCSTLIDMYAKSGTLEDACMVFDKLPKRNVVIWNSVIAGYAHHGFDHEAFQLFLQMRWEGMEPDRVTFVCLLKACCKTEALELGHQICFRIIENGFECDKLVCNMLITMYTKCCSMECARAVFYRSVDQDIVSWSVLIAGYAQHGYGQEALQLFAQMQAEGLRPDKAIFVCTLRACSKVGSLQQGKWIHSCITDLGFDVDLYVSNGLIDMYAKFKSMEDARAVFDRLPKKDLATWSALIAGYAQDGHGENAIQMFQQMQKDGVNPNRLTFVSALQACSSRAALQQGEQIHSQIIAGGYEADLFVMNTLIDMYSKCGNLDHASIVFARLPRRDVVTWTVLITGNIQYGNNDQALQLFQKMGHEGLEPDEFMFVSILQACSNTGNLMQGKLVHTRIIENGLKSDVFIGNTLIDMYSKCGSLDNAQGTFDRLPKQDVVTWNALITGYTQHGNGHEALHIFEQMLGRSVEPDKFTFVCVLQACSSIVSLEQGERVHYNIVENGLEMDLFVGNNLINMYAKCGSLENACKLFDRLPTHDVVSWNALITGCTHCGYCQEALQLFQQMQQKGVEPNEITFVCILQVCSNIAALEQGSLIHKQVIERGFQSNAFVGNALMDMYAKCGSLANAKVVFETLPKQDVITWSVLIQGYAQHSNYTLAMQSFKDMQQAGLKPDSVACLCLLSACSHAGLVDEACLHFKLMVEDHGIRPAMEHYSALVDSFGPENYLNEAEDLLETLPFQPSCVGWMSLLSSCRKHSNVELGRRCFDYVVSIEGGSSTGYVLMSSIYAHAGMWEEAERMEELRKSGHVWKKPAKAYIEINNQVHVFGVGDSTHPQAVEINAKLTMLSMQVREAGYISFLDSNPEDYKKDALCGHCEKLAIAFGLISTPHGTTIRIAKNLRVCADCHNVAKVVSRLERREIIITDIYCVHHFDNGVCCCRD